MVKLYQSIIFFIFLKLILDFFKIKRRKKKKVMKKVIHMRKNDNKSKQGKSYRKKTENEKKNKYRK